MRTGHQRVSDEFPARRVTVEMCRLVAALLLILLASCGTSSKTSNREASSSTADSSAAKQPGDSPQSVFQAARDAAAAYRWTEFCSYLTPDARDTLAASLCLAGNMMRRMAAMAQRAGDQKIATDMEQKTGPVVKVLERHSVSADVFDGIDPQQLSATKPSRELIEKLIAPISDRDQFIADMLEALLQIPGERPYEAFAGELTEVKIEADRATGTLVQNHNGKQEREPVQFRRIAGAWRIEFSR